MSVNFLVIIILSIAMFGFGIYFTKQIFTKSNEMSLKIDQDTNQKMEELLNDGSRVVIAFQTKTIRRGSLGVFGIGVLNMNTTDVYFKIGNPSSSYTNTLTIQGFSKEGTPIADPENFLDVNFNNEAILLTPLQTTKFAIGVAVKNGAPSGTYVLDVGVGYGISVGDTFTNYQDEVYKLYVVVP